MNNAEKKHLRKLLAEFATDDLTSLTETITQKRVSVTNTKDAINAIIQHSGSSEEFLNRRKVNRDILFHYSRKNNLKFSQNITKEEIVRKILDYWRQDVPKKSVQAKQEDQSTPMFASESSSTASSNMALNVFEVQVGQVNQSTPSFAPESSNAASSSVALNVGQVQVGQEVVTKKSTPKKKKIAFECAFPSATPTFTPIPSNTASSSVALNVAQVQVGQEVGTKKSTPKKKKTAFSCAIPSATPTFTPIPSATPNFTPIPSNTASSNVALNVAQVQVGQGVGTKKSTPKKKKNAFDCVFPSATPTFTPIPSNTASSSVALNVAQVQVGQEVGTKKSTPKKKKAASDCVFPSATPTFTPEPSNMPSSSAAINVVQVQVGQEVGAKKSKPKKKKNASDCVFPSATTTQSAEVTPSDLQLFGEKFATWFYESLDSLNPKFGKPPQDFGCHLFMDDAEMILLVGDSRNEIFKGSRSVTDRHLKFVKEEQVLFNPNICKEGVMVRSSPHGLTLVAVCGTVHRENQCLGCFDQMFGLVRDPLVENNWKIKLTRLKLQTTQVSSKPQLVDKTYAEIEGLFSV